MGFLSSVVGILGFGIGLPIGIVIGFYFFIYSQPDDVEEPVVKPLEELDSTRIEDFMPGIPFWVKRPDYDRVDWLNKFLLYMWPFLDEAICAIIRSTAKPIFDKYVGKFKVESIEFVTLTLGSVPPIFHGLKVCETNDKELVMEPVMYWAGNPNIIVEVTISSMQVKLQLMDLQVSAAPRITLKPLVPTIPCFGNVMVSLIEKPNVDFGLKVLGGDVMAIPGLYRYVQETIRKQISLLYLWPKFLEIPVLDASAIASKKPVGILHVKVMRATKLLKMDLIGLSDPYVKLKLSGDNLPSKKTTVKKKTLNPEWNETFKLIVKDPQSQLLNISMYDWDKVGGHDRLGKQVYPLKMLNANETREVTLDLLKSTDISDHQNKKQRGRIVLELTYAPFREDDTFSRLFSGHSRKDTGISKTSINETPSGAGLLSVAVQGAENVEGVRHTNPYLHILFRGETKKSKSIRRNRNPRWDEEFQFMLEEPPLQEKIRIVVMSKRTGISFRSKESLGHVDISLDDVVYNGRINHKYHLIDSKNGIIHVELGWKPI
ncbi:membrane trafficking regulatory protein [Lithospermum erythrorhizon]|uniref:Membrane trafficking regulatory protein n=1 Tax=Lithospermum erythrorhizon TaxID=34254 RepID=A0AAV3Q9S5_LITER